ncbi:hypothetical protein ES332_A01G208600v1 [Gossypium tomentosum]|uniref:Knottin scorpion toxin-like domain-containing protein n=1 Tax=Gossypium tomentosum TaxID=34277 RepID=A0A5D2RW59_GOSTO|nr:hypothetical protein ES332_A01G208600v1 [Gossypium tomentosum]
MNKLQMSAILIVAILFAIGNEIMAQDGEGKLCAIPFDLPNCTDGVCKTACANKFPPNGYGMCQGGSTCLCFHPCL